MKKKSVDLHGVSGWVWLTPCERDLDCVGEISWSRRECRVKWEVGSQVNGVLLCKYQLEMSVLNTSPHPEATHTHTHTSNLNLILLVLFVYLILFSRFFWLNKQYSIVKNEKEQKTHINFTQRDRKQANDKKKHTAKEMYMKNVSRFFSVCLLTSLFAIRSNSHFNWRYCCCSWKEFERKKSHVYFVVVDFCFAFFAVLFSLAAFFCFKIKNHVFM